MPAPVTGRCWHAAVAYNARSDCLELPKRVLHARSRRCTHVRRRRQIPRFRCPRTSRDLGDEAARLAHAAAKVREFPQTPGVYLMKDAAGRVIYVGKAKNLRARAGSYFLKAAAEDRRTADLVREIADIDFLEAESEVDALLVEARLIKDMQPKFNHDLKDDKTFPYLEITTREDFPRVEFTREPHERGTKLYGPFASAGSLRGAMQVLQKIFKFRTCSLDIDEDDEKWRWFRPCLLASINQCTAPCNLRISKEEYRRDIHRLRMFLEGKKKTLLDEMRQEMAAAADGAEVREGGPAARRDPHAGNARRARRAGHARAARGVLHRSEEGAGRAAEGAQAGRAAADDRRRRHRPPGRRRNRGQPGAVHRRPAVQAGLPALQDPRRRRASTISPASTKWSPGASSGCDDDERGVSRHAADRRRQGPAQRRPGGLSTSWTSTPPTVISLAKREEEIYRRRARTSRCG